jgi:hypothetical protein
MHRRFLVGLILFGLLVSRSSGLQLELDSSFSGSLNQPLDQVTSYIPTPDGRFYVSAITQIVNGTPRESFLRLNSDGSVDPTFS